MTHHVKQDNKDAESGKPVELDREQGRRLTRTSSRSARPCPSRVSRSIRAARPAERIAAVAGGRFEPPSRSRGILAACGLAAGSFWGGRRRPGAGGALLYRGARHDGSETAARPGAALSRRRQLRALLQAGPHGRRAQQIAQPLGKSHHAFEVSWDDYRAAHRRCSPAATSRTTPPSTGAITRVPVLPRPRRQSARADRLPFALTIPISIEGHMTLRIDLHTHVLPPTWEDWAAKFGGGRWPRLVPKESCRATIMTGDQFFRDSTTARGVPSGGSRTWIGWGSIVRRSRRRR